MSVVVEHMHDLTKGKGMAFPIVPKFWIGLPNKRLPWRVGRCLRDRIGLPELLVSRWQISGRVINTSPGRKMSLPRHSPPPLSGEECKHRPMSALGCKNCSFSILSKSTIWMCW